MREVHSQRHVRVPLVSPAGAHLADLSLDLRFFHSRNPGGRGCSCFPMARTWPVLLARAVLHAHGPMACGQCCRLACIHSRKTNARACTLQTLSRGLHSAGRTGRGSLARGQPGSWLAGWHARGAALAPPWPWQPTFSL